MIRFALRRCARALALLAHWVLWLVLAATLAAQLYIATHHVMAVPRPVLAALEARLSVSGLRADFGRTRFDPTGRILIEDVRLRFEGFEDPVITAQVVDIRLNPVKLLAGRFDPSDVRVSGLAARVPAMLSPSGTADEVLADADVEIQPRGRLLRIPAFSGRVGEVGVAGSGEVVWPSFPSFAPAAAGASAGGPSSSPAIGLGPQYAAFSQRAAQVLAVLGVLERPVLRLNVSPLAGALGRLDFVLSADALHIAGPTAVHATRVQLAGSWNLSAEEGAPARLEVRAERVAVPGYATAHDLLGWIDGVGAPVGARLPIAPHAAHLLARSIEAAGASVTAPSGSVDLTDWPRVSGSAGAWLWGEPLSVSGAGDVAARSGALDFRARVGPEAARVIDTRWRPGLTRYVAWTRPIEADGSVRWRAGGHFESVSADVAGQDITARTVKIDDVRARVEFDGRHLRAPRAFARVGDNLAYGSFEQDLLGNYRLLLQGRLRPLAITPWIAGQWWPELFAHFQFPDRPPTASIDLRGRWTDGRQAMVILDVDAPGTRVEGLPFDGLSARIFSRPQFTEALSLSLRRGAGTASGRFARWFNFKADAWQTLELQLDSTLDPVPVLALLGPDGKAALAGIGFAQPPAVSLTATFAGPGDPDGPHRRLSATVVAPGRLSFHGLPFDDARFTATLQDDDLTVDSAKARIAGGEAAGEASLTGPGSNRRLKFTVGLTDVSLPQAVAAAGTFSGKASGIIRSGAAVRVNATAAAEGRFGDPYSFQGSGHLDLRGGEIGELHMLGTLSQLLRFTALRFTTATADFLIQGHELSFPEVVVTGSNSAITARGTCGLDHGDLDFRARLNPFKESHSFPQQFMDLVLTPLADVLEVRLTGTVTKPSWAFVNGPTNLLRNLGPPNGVAPVQ